LEIAHAYQQWKRTGTPREALLMALASIPGVYVPSFYEVAYNADGTIQSVTPRAAQVSFPVVKRIVPKLPPPTTQFVVPNCADSPDRLSIEIMRGCTRGCRFCHAGMVNRPVRERSVEEITAAIAEGLKSTGYEEIGILSLSSSDYTYILELTRAIYAKFKDSRVSVTLPSLRIASFSVDLMDELKDLRPGAGLRLRRKQQPSACAR